jgi:hypothetical protein
MDFPSTGRVFKMKNEAILLVFGKNSPNPPYIVQYEGVLGGWLVTNLLQPYTEVKPVAKLRVDVETDSFIFSTVEVLNGKRTRNNIAKLGLLRPERVDFGIVEEDAKTRLNIERAPKVPAISCIALL